MTWAELLPWLAQGGVVGVLALLGYRLHADAVAAERRRADDWRTAAGASEARAAVRDEQVAMLLGRMREPAP